MDSLSFLPLDADGLERILDSLNTSYSVDEQGNHVKVNGTFTLTELLDWYSGREESKVATEEVTDTGIPVYFDGIPKYSSNDLIRALVLEIRRLRRAQINPGSIT